MCTSIVVDCLCHVMVGTLCSGVALTTSSLGGDVGLISWCDVQVCVCVCVCCIYTCTFAKQHGLY